MKVKIQLPNGAGMQMNIRRRDTTMAHLLQRVRRYCHVEPHEGLFLMIDKDGIESIPMMSMRLSELLEGQVVKVLKESTFGCCYVVDVECNWSYEYSYLLPCFCNPRVMQLHGPIYDSEGTRYNLDKWIRVDVFSDGPSRNKKMTTTCSSCKPKLDGHLLIGQMVRTNLL